jgi:hypothetical protein
LQDSQKEDSKKEKTEEEDEELPKAKTELLKW